MRKIDLLGCVLGDGYISKKGVLTMRHSYKQKTYLEYKYAFCQEIYKGRNFHLVDVPTQNGIQFSVSDASTFKHWRKWYYPEGKKRITQQLLNRLTKQAIAFWFCDDGSMSFKKRKNGSIAAVDCTISTYCSDAETDLIIDYFKTVWGMRLTKKRNKKLYSVRFGTKEGRTFVALFGDFIPECMSYKISKLKNFTGTYGGIRL